MKDDTTPATKADIQRLESNMNGMDGRIQSMDNRIQSMEASMKHMDSAIQRLDSRMDRMETGIQGLQEEVREMAKGLNAAIDQILTVLVNVDKRLSASVENHERRITRLEARVGIGA